MKAEELMSGDWLKYKDSKVLAHVTGAVADKLYHEIPPYPDDGGYAHISKFEPIPITAEILEKNGYKVIDAVWFDEKRQYYEWKNKDAWTEQCTLYYDITAKEWYAEVENLIQDNHIQGFFSFVHELQHALKVCKIEKEIKP